MYDFGERSLSNRMKLTHGAIFMKDDYEVFGKFQRLEAGKD